MQRPWMLWPLIILLLLLAVGGFYGGAAMLVDPSGSSLQVEETLPLLPVSNFILPGLFLLIVMGIIPVFLGVVLITRPDWPWAMRMFRWSKHHWAWTGTILLVLVVAVWLLYEGWLIGWFPITYITAYLGLGILLFALIPGVRRFYAEN